MIERGLLKGDPALSVILLIYFTKFPNHILIRSKVVHNITDKNQSLCTHNTNVTNIQGI